MIPSIYACQSHIHLRSVHESIVKMACLHLSPLHWYIISTSSWCSRVILYSTDEIVIIQVTAYQTEAHSDIKRFSWMYYISDKSQWCGFYHLLFFPLRRFSKYYVSILSFYLRFINIIACLRFLNNYIQKQRKVPGYKIGLMGFGLGLNLRLTFCCYQP